VFASGELGQKHVLQSSFKHDWRLAGTGSDGRRCHVAVITSLGYEHVEALGGSLHSITGAKAGIIHPGCSVVVGHQVSCNTASGTCELFRSANPLVQ
jgi:hypothetical protein